LPWIANEEESLIGWLHFASAMDKLGICDIGAR
jgi:hypothetical protein